MTNLFHQLEEPVLREEIERRMLEKLLESAESGCGGGRFQKVHVAAV
jgi:hypothetical protein